MILVVGATGKVGTEICRRLGQQHMPFRALVRTSSSPGKVAQLRELGAEIAVGDLREWRSLDAACAGVDSVITTVSSMPYSYVAGVNDIETTDLSGTKRLIAAAENSGVKHFTYLSFSRNINVESPLHSAKRAIEHEIRESGFGYTILRPSYFMEVWLSPAVGFDPVEGKATICGDGRAPVSWIHVDDVAEFAVRSLTSPVARNAILELGGPDALSPLEVVELFERLSGHPMELTPVSEEELAQQQRSATDDMARSFTALMRVLALGDAIDMSDLLERMPIELTSVEQYARAVLWKQPARVG
jgi:uncharacterized protein YbjT (DUF2867 family)